jgi:hypothetical protein
MFHSRCRLIGMTAAAAAVAVLALVPAAFAGQPVTQTLNPPPAPEWTCKAVGNGTICTATASYSYGPEDTGIACSSFEILDAATVTDRVTARYDANGNLVEVVKHETSDSAQFTNSVTGAALPYRSNVTITNTFPGENVLSVARGQMNFTASGFGAVALNAGRLVDLFDGNDNILFEAGPHSLFPDLYLYGDTSVVDRLCAALSA